MTRTAYFEIGDKVQVSCEGYVGPAYIREFTRDGAWISVERFGKPFFATMRSLSKI